ncbi:MAG: alpha/beta fold hydrolase [Planctomycetota bacterium]
MLLVLSGIGIFGLATLLLALGWMGVRHLLGRRPRWRRSLWLTLFSLPAHALITVPLTLGFLGSRMVATRRDESAYRGPRFLPDGTWIPQSRASLKEELAAGGVAPSTAPARSIELRAEDGVRLRAFFVPGAAPTRPVDAILVHGLFRGGLELETVGRFVRDLGCDVLMLELRNHGGSERAGASFGPREALDVRAAAAWLDGRPGAGDRRVLVFGVSLGTVAAALAAPHVQRLRWLVLDAPVVNPLATAKRMLARGPKNQRRRFGLPEPFCTLALSSLELWAGIDLDAIRPLDALRQLDPAVRAMVVGAGADDRVTASDVEAAWQAIPCPDAEKSLWIEPDAAHGAVWEKDPDRYRRELERLLQR